jgi:hypothetical protein
MDDEGTFWRGHVGEPVPSVNVADLKAAWEIGERIESQHAGGTVAIASTVIENACSPGADIRSIGYRCGMLRILEMCRGDVLATWKQSGQFHDGVFRVVATIPMTWIGEGLSQRLPFDVDAFLEELRKEAP